MRPPHQADEAHARGTIMSIQDRRLDVPSLVAVELKIPVHPHSYSQPFAMSVPWTLSADLTVSLVCADNTYAVQPLHACYMQFCLLVLPQMYAAQL